MCRNNSRKTAERSSPKQIPLSLILMRLNAKRGLFFKGWKKHSIAIALIKERRSKLSLVVISLLILQTHAHNPLNGNISSLLMPLASPSKNGGKATPYVLTAKANHTKDAN